MDSRLDILNVSPLSPSDWSVKVRISPLSMISSHNQVVTPSLPQSHTAFICTRLKKNLTLVLLFPTIINNPSLSKSVIILRERFHVSMRISSSCRFNSSILIPSSLLLSSFQMGWLSLRSSRQNERKCDRER